MAYRRWITITTYFPIDFGSGDSGEIISPLYNNLLNSVDHYFIIGAQSQGAVLIKQYGLEAIPMGYMVFGGDTAVAAMGRALPLPPSRGEVAACYALAAQYLGMRFVYLEAGSGAREPIPPETIRAVRRVLEIPLIVGGGIRSPE
ncbi:MAG TPA: geranylgeranylglyceryl phosphate synthase family protein, partial [Candidatus Korarchaeota archaeon]|nr:geranylgeranylglyceryl phosphate synthase family protein [Candidatus Korarchaeota archaeon]